MSGWGLSAYGISTWGDVGSNGDIVVSGVYVVSIIAVAGESCSPSIAVLAESSVLDAAVAGVEGTPSIVLVEITAYPTVSCPGALVEGKNVVLSVDVQGIVVQEVSVSV